MLVILNSLILFLVLGTILVILINFIHSLPRYRHTQLKAQWRIHRPSVFLLPLTSALPWYRHIQHLSLVHSLILSLNIGTDPAIGPMFDIVLSLMLTICVGTKANLLETDPGGSMNVHCV